MVNISQSEVSVSVVINQSEAYLEYSRGHHKNDDAGGPEAAEEDEDREEDGREAGDHVLPQLLADDLVCLPVGVS